MPVKLDPGAILKCAQSNRELAYRLRRLSAVIGLPFADPPIEIQVPAIGSALEDGDAPRSVADRRALDPRRRASTIAHPPRRRAPIPAISAASAWFRSAYTSQVATCE